jgi:hypothetical protein
MFVREFQMQNQLINSCLRKRTTYPMLLLLVASSANLADIAILWAGAAAAAADVDADAASPMRLTNGLDEALVIPVVILATNGSSCP